MSYLERFKDREVPDVNALRVRAEPTIELAVMTYEWVRLLKLRDMDYADRVRDLRKDGACNNTLFRYLLLNGMDKADFLDIPAVPKVRIYGPLDYASDNGLSEYSSTDKRQVAKCMRYLNGKLIDDAKAGMLDIADIVLFSNPAGGTVPDKCAHEISSSFHCKVKIVSVDWESKSDSCMIEIVNGTRDEITKRIDRYLELPFVYSMISQNAPRGGDRV